MDTRKYVSDTFGYERIERISGRWPQVYLPAIPTMSSTLFDDIASIQPGCHPQVSAVHMRIALKDGITLPIARALGPLPLFGT